MMVDGYVVEVTAVFIGHGQTINQESSSSIYYLWLDWALFHIFYQITAS